MINISNNKWNVTSGPAALKDDEVDLWRVNLDCSPASINSLVDLLSDDEKDRANKFVFAKDKGRFIACRGTLRRVIGDYLGTVPRKIKFAARRYGKPYISAEDLDLRFNVSHSRGIAVIAVSLKREVGVDVEFVDRNFDVFKVAPSLFSAVEVSRLRSLPSRLQTVAFFASWTQREALLKATGDGFSSSEELQTTISLSRRDEVSHTLFVNEKITEWSATSFEIHDDFKGALVVEGKMGAVRCWQLADDLGVGLPSERSFL